VELSPFPCHLIPRRSKYSPQHPVLKHPQSVRLRQKNLRPIYCGGGGCDGGFGGGQNDEINWKNISYKTDRSYPVNKIP
jgi:hypothetical protein